MRQYIYCKMPLVLAVLFLLSTPAIAQQNNVWTLQSAVQYALNNNISIKKNELNKRLAELTLQQSQLSQIPNVNVNTAYGRSYGRSVDPTTNQFFRGSYDFLSVSGNADVLLFGWFQKRKTIERNRYSLEAAKSDLEQLQNDVSLNVATGFLRALLAKEQINVSEKQVDLSKAQLEQTRQFVKAGRLPELNAAQLESQLAGDSTNLINAISTYNSAILDIKALLNLDFATPFEIQSPKVSLQDQITLGNMNPEMVYATASRSFNSIRAADMRILAAQRGVDAAKAGLYPTFGLSAQLGSNYATTYTEPYNIRIADPTPTGGFIPFGDTIVYVYQPGVKYDLRKIPLGTQLDQNFRQTISLGMNVPVFNGWQSRYSVKQAKINLLNSEFDRDNVALTLKQDVYKAYNEALNAIQKYQSAERAADAANRAYEFAQKRYELGLTNTVEYLTTQNTQFVSESNLLSAKYDLIFKLKVIDYYLGKELKL